MDAGKIVLGAATAVAGILFLVFRERLGERARARGAAYDWTLYVAAGALLFAFGVISIVRGALGE